MGGGKPAAERSRPGSVSSFPFPVYEPVRRDALLSVPFAWCIGNVFASFPNKFLLYLHYFASEVHF